MEMKRLTPVLYVEEIEPALDFWRRLGYEVTAQVPEGDHLGFVILESGSVQVMYQTRASVVNDLPALSDTPLGGAFLFVEVDDLEAVMPALEGAEVISARRETFYGSDEITVREPGGNAVTFAQFGAGEEG
jgi:catechol 2,3-dioxygenase-like lactoylglutathione lyase family enzyme